jgi:hypothetical protein
MARKKKLSYTNVKKEDTKMSEQLIAEVKNYTFKVDKFFKDSKTMDLIAEMLVKLQEAKQDGIDLKTIFIPYTILLLIKHFTDIDVPENINEQIAFLRMLIDQDLVNGILESFPKEDVERVSRKIQEAMEEREAMIDELSQQLEAIEAENELKIRELFEEEDEEDETTELDK